jgi:hypothetical protein
MKITFDMLGGVYNGRNKKGDAGVVEYGTLSIEINMTRESKIGSLSCIYPILNDADFIYNAEEKRLLKAILTKVADKIMAI